MIENVYKTLTNDRDVSAYVGNAIYMSMAPQNAAAPFIVWSLISSNPYNTLSDIPDADQQRVQVDFYAKDPTVARIGAKKVRNCLQRHYVIISGPEPVDWDTSTDLYRWTMDSVLVYQREEA